MSSRARRSQSQSLNSIESLLLAQSAWELGASQSTWSPIAKVLSKHPLLSRPKFFFTPQSCHSLYDALMKDAGLEVNDSIAMPHAPLNLQLAQKHYQARFKELQSLILDEESKFRIVLKEIEDIRAGRWDKEDASKKDEILGSHRPSTTTQPVQLSHENLSGSTLKGITDFAESDTQAQKETHMSNVSPDDDDPTNDKTPSPESPDTPVQSQESSASTSLTPKPEEIPPLSNEAEGIKETTPIVQSPSKNSQPSSPMDIGDEDHHDTEFTTQHKQTEIPDKPVIGIKTIHPADNQIDQRQEEDEEEARKDETNRDEEDVSVGHRKDKEDSKDGSEMLEADVTIEQGHQEENFRASQGGVLETDSERAQSPIAAETAGSEVEPVPEDNQSSELEEPVAPTRRSSRKRKSSAASLIPPQTRTRMRTKVRMSETESYAANPGPESENEVEEEMKEDTPQIEEERTSSPFDGATTRRRDAKRKASFLDNAESPSEKKRLREDSEPVDEEEPGPSSHSTRTRITRHGTRTEEQVALKRFQNVIGMLHSQISQHRNGNIFHNPIKNSEAPDYHDIVKRPMDLKTIKTRVKDGVIANSLEFQRDIYLMFANAMMYNRPGSDVHAMAEDMMLESEGQINTFRQTEGLVKRGQRA